MGHLISRGGLFRGGREANKTLSHPVLVGSAPCLNVSTVILLSYPCLGMNYRSSVPPGLDSCTGVFFVPWATRLVFLTVFYK